MAPGASTSHTIVLKHTGILPIPFTNQLRIVAEGAIAPFVTIAQPKFPALFKRGNQVSFQVTISLPANTPAGEIKGSLLLKRILSGKETEVWRADSLPISIQVSQGIQRISWNTPSLEVEALNGTVVVKPVSFKVNQSIANPAFQIETLGGGVSPIDLASLIEIQSSKSSAITESDEVQLGVVFKVATDVPEGEYLGALHVLDGNRMIVQPLELKLFVKDGSAYVVPGGFADPVSDRITTDNFEDVRYVQDEVILVLKQGVSIDAISAVISSMGGIILGGDPELNLYQLRFPGVTSLASLESIINDLKGNLDIAAVSRNWEVLPLLDSQDPYYSAWDESNPSGNEAPLEYVQLPSAWGLVYGSNDKTEIDKLNKINVAIVDDGFDLLHLDLYGNINQVFSSPTAKYESIQEYHGTKVAGVVGAVANNNIGITGVTWNVDLRLYDHQNLFWWAPIMATALKDAVRDGAQVINLSAGTQAWLLQNQSDLKDIYEPVFNYCSSSSSPKRCASDVLFVFGVGNSKEANKDKNFKTMFPAALSDDYTNVISVTAVENVPGSLVPDHTIGLAAQGGNVSVAAPSVLISTVPGDNYEVVNGTSFATPMVSGLAGLLLTKNENLTPAQLKKIIIDGACFGGDKIVNSLQGANIPPSIPIINAYESVKLADNPNAVVCHPLGSTQFTDSNLTECINSQNWQYVEQASSLSCSSKAITNLSGIENLKYLRTLDLSGNTISDLTPLMGLTQLEQLNLSGITGLRCVDLDNLAAALSSTTINRPADCVQQNSNPVAVDDTKTAQSGVSTSVDVLANDTDADGDTLKISSVTQAANGSVTHNDTSVTYTSNAGFAGTDTFTYTAFDGNDGSATATVTVTVTAIAPPATWSIDPASVSVSESAGTVTFTINRTNSTAAQTVYVSTVQNQGATNNGDYVGKLNEPVPFVAGQAQRPVTVTINKDTIVEGNETFRLIVQESTTDPINTSVASATFTILDSGTSTPTGKLNDTGITACSNATTNGLACPVAGFPGQDAQYGRDAQALAGTLQKVGGGEGGFDFTKLDSNGNPLPANASAWDCVKDNVTGLIWEVKTDDGGLRDKDNTYSWYEPDSSRNGGGAGLQNGGSCTGSACDTQGYLQAVNVQGLCGTSDWRMPDVNELLSIVNNATVNPAIDTNYIPPASSIAWSSSPGADRSANAWYVVFYYGNVISNLKTTGVPVRLVRGGQ